MSKSDSNLNKFASLNNNKVILLDKIEFILKFYRSISK